MRGWQRKHDIRNDARYLDPEVHQLKLGAGEMGLDVDQLKDDVGIIGPDLNQLKLNVGSLSGLDTVAKNNVISAINEVVEGILLRKIDTEQRGINVRQPPYNARADGIADDTGAIQSALAAGKKIFFPKGQYKISDTLSVGSGHILIGDSAHSTFIIQSMNNRPIMRVLGAHYKIESLHMSFLNQQNDDSSGGVGIELGDSSIPYGGAHEGIIKSIIIEKSYRGIAIPGWGGQPFAFMNIIENVRVLDSWDYAFHFGGRLNIGLTTNTFRNCYALFQSTNTNPKAKGFYIAMHDDFVMENCAVDHAMEDALTLEYNQGGTIIDFHAEACRLSKNYMSMIRINQSKARFINLQLPFSIVNAGVAEAYFISANLGSEVVIDRLVERDTTVHGTGSYFSVITDPTSFIKIGSLKVQHPTILLGASDIEMKVAQAVEKPTSGKWKRRDIVLHDFPAPNRPVGWICLEGGEFGTASPPYFVPFGVVSSDPNLRHYEFDKLTVQDIVILNGYNFNKLTTYNASTNIGFDIGASNADAVDPSEVYSYRFFTKGNSTGQKLYLQERRRGNASPVDVLAIGKTDIDFYKKILKNVVLQAGTTRPSSPVIGQMFFDANLGKPIFHNGTRWVDAVGANV